MNDVYVNEIKIGEISNAKYDQVCRAVRRDIETWAAQALNIIYALGKIVVECVEKIPSASFFIAVLLYIFAPDAFRTMFNTMTPNDALHGIFVVFMLLQLLAFISILFGNRFGFMDMFERARFTHVSREFGSAALGTMAIIPQTVSGDTK